MKTLCYKIHRKKYIEKIKYTSQILNFTQNNLSRQANSTNYLHQKYFSIYTSGSKKLPLVYFSQKYLSNWGGFK